MSDLFDREFHASRAGGYSSPGHVYPNTPGFKGSAETGREAAEAISDKLGRLQRQVFNAVKGRGTNGLTPEEAADLLAIDRVSVQPRFSELKAKGLIADSGKRRVNPSSHKRAVVWVLACFTSDDRESGA
ncbi:MULTISPECIES: hypothetical protein [unclassified Sphingobium]|uniref:hypothetical protein n=1 Tax=unclassified Sphingobium TaxID=2611147 RepID=UPI000AC94FAC|nr:MULTISPECIES: hypothetical protein [unclassified Sphingobium]UXC89504.1 hypothetical protein EGM87_10480 [Sphingobium sp. RSMS]